MVRHATRGNLNQPAARIVRNSFPRPLGERRDHRLLHRIFGCGEVMKTANHRAEHLRRQLAQQMLVLRTQTLFVTMLRLDTCARNSRLGSAIGRVPQAAGS